MPAQHFAHKQKIYIATSGFALATIIWCGFFIPKSVQAAPAENSVEKLNQQIESQKTEIDKINKRIELYQKRIKESQQEAVNLRGQIKLLDNEMAKKQLDIDLSTKQIAKTNLEIQLTTQEIAGQEERIEKQRSSIRYLLQLVYRSDQVSYLEIILTNNTFSDFYDYYQHLQDIQARLQRSLQKLKGLQTALVLQQDTLKTKKSEDEKLKDTLEQQRRDLAEQSVHQATILKETERSEKKFANYVDQLKVEQQQINQDIVGIEKKIREELKRQQEEADRIAAFGKPRLQWPTNGRYITSYFHDPEYPYRNIFEHPAIDVRTAQGSTVRAAESGYVAKVKDGGAKGYSYLMIVHNDGLSTVYGHVSSFDVQENQFVKQGQVVARSGGTPGTRGAGNLTSGPHLHFEVRNNGIPVNPLSYLPSE
ncbi:MAG: peptidoglycan DD-metalloendopeptidase family protein [Patescibacteria group bacterium]|nr:peptidoglycan DD-metalloendopeptidase family protein [Patescibacteria group bacterium]